MGDQAGGAQEARTERATIMLTPDEKRAVRLVAAARDVTESELLRVALLADILSEFGRIQKALPKVA